MIKNTNRSLLQLRIIYLLTTIFLVALSIYAFLQIKNLIDSSQWINHTNQVKLSLEKIKSANYNAEINQKNFLLTGDSSLLKNRDDDINRVAVELNLIDKLTKDNPEQIENLKTLNKAIDEKLLNMKNVMGAYTPQSFSPEFKMYVIETRYKNEKIKEQINKMLIAEKHLLALRTQKFSHLAIITPLYIIVLFLGSLVILLISYFKINDALNLSQQLRRKVEATNKELEKKNEELRKSGEQFFKIFDNNPVAMTFGEISTNRLVYANDLFYTSFGYTKEEVIGHSTEELNLVSKEETERLLPIIMSSLEEKRSVEELKALPSEETAKLLLKLKETMFENGYEILYTQKNGEKFYAIVFYEIIDIGNKKYALTSYLNITERKKALQQLAEQKAFADLVIENDPAMIIAYDKNLHIITWNKHSEEQTGMKKEEVLGKHILDVFPEYNNEQWLSVMNSVLKDGKTLHHPKIAFQHIKGFGESWIMPLRNVNQQIVGVLTITRDITEATKLTRSLEQKNIVLEKTNKELQLTSATLKKSEERYHRMITEVKDYAIIFISKEGNIENWNEGAEKIKGYKAYEIIGKNFSQFYTEEDRKNNLPQKFLNKAAEEGKAIHEGWRVRKNGSRFWASIVITALHDDTNNIIGFSKVTHDLTDKKIAEDKILATNKILEQKNIELQKINKELESFNYISSHDLQEPLRQIQIFASRITDIEQQNLSDAGKNYFEKMKNAAQRMQNLIADLLAYSRTKTEPKKFKTISLNQIINEVTEEFAETIEEQHAKIEVGELKDVFVIPFQFRQMIYNLIGNALKFSKPDTPPHIIIKNEKVTSSEVPDALPTSDSEYYHISIADNGIGFEPQYKDRIFEVFQRLHDKQKVAGTGMGLAIVKIIVENHNGIIKATGALNKGATFDIYIPTTQKI